jgi:2-amino-4-hydroxy-6-hydroxymethyldihydropteridine diphosphokinase
MVDKIYLALGSNIGDRLSHLKFAVDQFKENSKCRVLKSSAVYETKPMGNLAQDNFFNAVIEIETALGFFDLFYFTKSIETKAGRDAVHAQYSPRELDIDIIFYNELVYSGEFITIPHKEYAHRDFVLQPLLEISPEFKHPVLRKKINEINYDNPEKFIIQKVADSLL